MYLHEKRIFYNYERKGLQSYTLQRPQPSKFFLEKNVLYFFLKKPALKKFIFWEIELSSLKLKDVLIFWEMKLLKKLLIYQEGAFQSGKNFLYFGKWNFLAPSL